MTPDGPRGRRPRPCRHRHRFLSHRPRGNTVDGVALPAAIGLLGLMLAAVGLVQIVTLGIYLPKTLPVGVAMLVMGGSVYLVVAFTSGGAEPNGVAERCPYRVEVRGHLIGCELPEHHKEPCRAAESSVRSHMAGSTSDCAARLCPAGQKAEPE